MSDDLVFFNGIHGSSGEYATPPRRIATVAAAARAHSMPRDEIQRTGAAARRSRDKQFALADDYNPDDLEDVGWGMVLPELTPDDHEGRARQQQILEALEPLLALRRRQAGSMYCDDLWYTQGESPQEFLSRFGVNFGRVEPGPLPYYILLCASPQEISFEFQYMLDIQFAVGRLYFDDVKSYRMYAEHMAGQEEREPPAQRKATFFGVVNGDKVDDDPATWNGVTHLIEGLHDYYAKKKACGNDLALEDEAGQPIRRMPTRAHRALVEHWALDIHTRSAATRERLLSLLGGEDKPAFLLVLAHGLDYKCDEPGLVKGQGALICNGWRPGEMAFEHAVFGGQLDENRDLAGQIAFLFACHSAGTPRTRLAFPDPSEKTSGEPPEKKLSPKQLAPHSLVARLPQRMLALGAQAVIGHIDNACDSSFRWFNPRTRKFFTHTGEFRQLMNGVFRGARVGHAMCAFNERYAVLAAVFTGLDDREAEGHDVSDREWAYTYRSYLDARNYILLGDPAARITTAAPTQPVQQANP